MIPWVLLGAQAAGMVFDYFGNQNQMEIGRAGSMMERQAIEQNIKLTRLQAEDASVQAMVNLRQTLGNQAAYLAARGTRAGAGSNVEASTTSISNYESDKRARNINQLAKEAELRAGIEMSKLHQQGFESKLNQDFYRKIFDMIPTNPGVFKSASSSGQQSSNSIGPRNTPRPQRNFGMTPFTG